METETKIAGEWADSKLVGVGIYTSKDSQTIKRVKMTEKGIVNAEMKILSRQIYWQHVAEVALV